MGDMVAFFRYSPIDILSVHLPPPVLQFGDHAHQDWLKKEMSEVRIYINLFLKFFSIIKFNVLKFFLFRLTAFEQDRSFI